VTEMDPLTPMEPPQSAMDSLLRSSIGAPVPSLAPDFDQRVLRELQRSSQPVDRYSRILLTGYALASVVTSAVVMRGQGLNWGSVTLLILGPLALLVGGPWARRATQRALPHTAE
jgi:hypothetical protein